VQDLVERINARFHSVIHASLAAASDVTRRKVESVLDFLGQGAIAMPTFPALSYALRHGGRHDELLDALLSLREHEQVAAFRNWCLEMDRGWRNQDLDAVCSAIEELQQVLTRLKDRTGRANGGAIMHAGNVGVLARSTDDATLASDDELVRLSYQPSLTFLSEIGVMLGELRSNRTAIEGLLGRRLTDEDLDAANRLVARAKPYSSPGKLRPHPDSLTVQQVDRLEVIMGDRFENIHSSIIATRGAIAQGVAGTRAQGRADIATAIEQLASLIEQSSTSALTAQHREELQDLLKVMAEETSKSQPNRTALRSVGGTLLEILRQAGPLLESAKPAWDIISQLWV
jgi:hypothetical protein